MNKKLNTILLLAVGIIIASCSQILQSPKLQVETSDRLLQQEFTVVEKTLTLSEAKSRRSDPFIRHVIQMGIGDKARLISEEVAIKSNFPKKQKKVSYEEYVLGAGDTISFINIIENPKTETSNNGILTHISSNDLYEPYTIGIGDQISFFNLIEKSTSQENIIEDWKQKNLDEPYVVGIGDELTLTQINEESTNANSVVLPARDQDSSANMSNLRSLEKLTPPDNTNNIIQTSGRVGSNGNLLLLEVGTLQASGKTINKLRSEVRNVLIRNGISPKFQLEITAFNSKKAYISLSSNASGRLL
jgi:protein involved in polysaccharide export with SLBB domain